MFHLPTGPPGKSPTPSSIGETFGAPTPSPTGPPGKSPTPSPIGETFGGAPNVSPIGDGVGDFSGGPVGDGVGAPNVSPIGDGVGDFPGGPVGDGVGAPNVSPIGDGVGDFPGGPVGPTPGPTAHAGNIPTPADRTDITSTLWKYTVVYLPTTPAAALRGDIQGTKYHIPGKTDRPTTHKFSVTWLGSRATEIQAFVGR
jgi:hypothetical protein